MRVHGGRDNAAAPKGAVETSAILFLEQDAEYRKIGELLFFILLLCPSYHNIYRKWIRCMCANAHFGLHENTRGALQPHKVAQQYLTEGLTLLWYHIQNMDSFIIP